MSKKENPFFAKKTLSSVDILQAENGIVLGEDKKTGEYCIDFKLSDGRGTAPVRIPISLMSQVVDVLEAGPNLVEENNVVDTIKNSLAYDIDEKTGEDLIIFRTGYGKGSKVQRIRKSEYAAVVAALRQIVDQLPQVVANWEDLNK